MNNLWKIQVLVGGYSEIPADVIARVSGAANTGIESLKTPFNMCYLTNGERHILVDNGISDEFLNNNPFFAEQTKSVGGEAPVREAFEKAGIELSLIDTVIYTHLHNDHCGNPHLFPDAVHVFQLADWHELLDPLPSMKPLNFDQSIIPIFQKLNCVEIEGDLDFLPGIKLILSPGHSAGSQVLVVDTKDGRYGIVGDLMHSYKNCYGSVDTLVTMEGEKIPLPPIPDYMDDTFILSNLIYDHYAWYRSIRNFKAMFPTPERVIPAHEPSVANKTYG